MRKNHAEKVYSGTGLGHGQESLGHLQPQRRDDFVCGKEDQHVHAACGVDRAGCRRDLEHAALDGAGGDPARGHRFPRDRSRCRDESARDDGHLEPHDGAAALSRHQLAVAPDGTHLRVPEAAGVSGGNPAEDVTRAQSVFFGHEDCLAARQRARCSRDGGAGRALLRHDRHLAHVEAFGRRNLCDGLFECLAHDAVPPPASLLG